MNHFIWAVKETARYWAVPVGVAFAIELIFNKEEK